MVVAAHIRAECTHEPAAESQSLSLKPYSMEMTTSSFGMRSAPAQLGPAAIGGITAGILVTLAALGAAPAIHTHVSAQER